MQTIWTRMLAICLVAGLSNGHSQPCPTLDEIPLQENFDVSKFMGNWFQLQWNPPEDFNMSQSFKDYRFIFSQNQDDASIIDIQRYGRLGESECHESSAILTMSDSVGANTTYTRPHLDGTLESPFMVLSTDYDSYAVTFGCLETNDEGICNDTRINVWVRCISVPLPADTMELIGEKVYAVCGHVGAMVNNTQENVCHPTETCPLDVCQLENIEKQTSFNKEKMVGNWFQLKWNQPADFDSSLVLKDYRWVYEQDEQDARLLHITKYARNADNTCYSSNATLRLEGSTAAGTYIRSWNEVEYEGTFVIVSTDYTTYMLVYHCDAVDELGFCNDTMRVNVFVRCATVALDDATKTLLHNKIQHALCVNLDVMISTTQENKCHKHDGDCPPPAGGSTYNSFSVVLTVMSVIATWELL